MANISFQIPSLTWFIRLLLIPILYGITLDLSVATSCTDHVHSVVEQSGIPNAANTALNADTNTILGEANLVSTTSNSTGDGLFLYQPASTTLNPTKITFSNHNQANTKSNAAGAGTTLTQSASTRRATFSSVNQAVTTLNAGTTLTNSASTSLMDTRRATFSSVNQAVTTLNAGTTLTNSASTSLMDTRRAISSHSNLPTGSSNAAADVVAPMQQPSSRTAPVEASPPSTKSSNAVEGDVFLIQQPQNPTLCTAGLYHFSSTMVRPTGAVIIKGNFSIQHPTTWNITAGDGLQLHNFSSNDGKHLSQTTMGSEGSISLKVPADNSSTVEIHGEVHPADVRPCPSTSGIEAEAPSPTTVGSSPSPPSVKRKRGKAHKMASESLPLTGSKGATSSAGSNSTTTTSSETLSSSSSTMVQECGASVSPQISGRQAATYTLTVVADIPCAKPTPQTCSPTHQPDFTVEQWNAYSVDQFWGDYVSKNKGGNLMTNFWNKYIGVGQDQISCSADGSNQHCVLDDPCDTIKAPPFEKVQAMFVSMAMINFAALITQVYETLNVVQSDMLEGGLTAQWVNVFQPDPKAPSTAWEHIMEVISGLIVFFAAFIIFFDPVWAPAAIGLMIGASSVFGLAGNLAPLLDPKTQEDFKLDAIENNTAIVENYVVTNQNTLSKIFAGYYDTGTIGNHSVVDLFRGGAWVGNIPEPSPQFAKNGSTRELASYLENIVVGGLINTWMKQSVYILFVPYGVANPDFKTTFSQADCEANYIGPDAKAGWVGSCSLAKPGNDQGMSVFVTSGDQQPVSWFNRDFTYPYGGYKYDPLDIMESSLNGYLTKGFNYNATQDIVSQLITDHDNTVVRDAITSLQPKTPGMFNIAVCRIADFDAIPHGSGHGKGTLQHIACNCLSNAANFTDPVSKNVTYFRDAISTGISDQLKNAYPAKEVCPFTVHS